MRYAALVAIDQSHGAIETVNVAGNAPDKWLT
jgi:hypothetical protein